MAKAARVSRATRGRAAAVSEALARLYPDAACSLRFRSPFELLVATVLSAQCTDARVNAVTPALLARAPDPAALAALPAEELEGLIRPTGFYRAKARNLLGLARALVERHGGVVPAELEALTALPGVGRKTAHVVLGDAFGAASGMVVDTHVGRIARRLGLTRADSPVAVERDLNALLPRDGWVAAGHRLIAHGRAVCRAVRPRCEACGLAALCPRVGVGQRPGR